MDIHIEDLPIVIHSLGPATCSSFRFSTEHEVINMKNQNVNPGDIVCFVVGEIDCRMHIHKYKDEYKEIIDEIVKYYLIGVKNENIINDVTILISFITPPPQDDSHLLDVNFMPQGKNIDRKMYVEYMNKKLKEECEKYNYIFFDTYDQYCDADGFFNMSLSDGSIHIGNTVYIAEKLQKIIENLKINL
jgi:hypothetical protein